MSDVLLAGIDCLLIQQPSWKLQRIGLVTNDAAHTRNGISVRKALVDNGFNIVCIFSPEHGLQALGLDGAPMEDQLDPVTQLPVISLYGAKLAPSLFDLAKLDLLLFDIPDAGTRFYTYLWTMTYCLESCASAHKKFIILDRPNPLSGDLAMAEGPLLQEDSCSSFIGRWSIPVRHSCTMGELANYFNQVKHIGCMLEIVCCKNWNRNQYYTDTGWNFIPPSPALQHFENMLLYPGTCLLEATNLHEGRGTQQAFTLVAAPWLTPAILIQELNTYGIEGVFFQTSQFISTTNKYPRAVCQAVLFTVTDQKKFKPVQFGIILLKCLKDLYPSFAWDVYPTAVNPSGKYHLDRLLGIPNAAIWFDWTPSEFVMNVNKHCLITTLWRDQVGEYLLYA